MPIEVKDARWSETEQYMVINVPLKGRSVKDVDIFSTNNYIKVSYPPYLFEVALFKDVEDESSKATVSMEMVTLQLEKKVLGVWGQLYSDKQKDKVFMKELRLQAVEYRQKKDQEKEKEFLVQKTKDKKFSVKEQMRIDNVEHEKIKVLKDEESQFISEDMENWKNDNLDTEQTLKDDILNKKNCAQPEVIRPTTKTKNIEFIPEEKPKSVPKPRTRGTIEVSFTPRVLATPARESKAPEEECWLSKVAEFNRMKNTDNPDATDIEEMNPMWLKDKGNDFYKKGNIIAAINAYSSALMLDSKIPMIYANRAACHLSMKQYNECIQDCTNALELYHPPVPDNALSRCRAFTRRGTAYFHKEDYVNSLRDYEEAIKLDPKNEELKNDSIKIRNIIQGD